MTTTPMTNKQAPDETTPGSGCVWHDLDRPCMTEGCKVCAPDEGVKAFVEKSALEAVRLQLRRDGYRVPNAALLLALDRAGFTLARPRLLSDNARLREAVEKR